MAKYVMQIMWYINNECNLRCKHCYVEKFCATPIDRLEIQTLTIDRIAQLNTDYEIIRVGMLGGEPLLDPNIFRLISSLRGNGIDKIDVSTNGTRVTRDTATKLTDVGVNMVQVSLDGPNQQTNDAIRGSGSFKRALNGLRLLVKADIKTTIMMTISKSNLGSIIPMVEMAHYEGIALIVFNRLLPICHGKSNKLPILSSSELRQMFELVRELRERYTDMDITSEDPLFHVSTNETAISGEYFGGCSAGIGNLAISYDGTVYPCRKLPIIIGNVRESSLLEIIESSELNCFYDRAIYLKGKCRTCLFVQSCGGCRAAALAITGDHLNSDPQCWLTSERR